MFAKLSSIGTLRIVHASVIILLILTAPFAGGEPAHSGLSMWPSLLAPAIAPIFLFVMGLDIMMAAIFRSSAEGAERERFSFILKVNVALLLGLFFAWLPFFNSLL